MAFEISPEARARLEERMKLARVAFKTSLPERLAAMRALLARLAHDDSRTVLEGARDELRRAAHQLTGTGTSYGLPELTAWGRQMEALCKAGAPSVDLARSVERLAALIPTLA